MALYSKKTLNALNKRPPEESGGLSIAMKNKTQVLIPKKMGGQELCTI